jgi:hypothetical protein
MGGPCHTGAPRYGRDDDPRCPPARPRALRRHRLRRPPDRGVPARAAPRRGADRPGRPQPRAPGGGPRLARAAGGRLAAARRRLVGSRLPGRPRAGHAGARHHRRALPPLRAARSWRRAPGGHPLRRPDGRGAVHARGDRALRRPRPRVGRADRPHLRLRLDPVRPRRSCSCTRRRRPTARGPSRRPARRRGLKAGRAAASLARGGRSTRRADGAARADPRRPVRPEPRPRAEPDLGPQRDSSPRPTPSSALWSPFVMGSTNTPVVRRSNACRTGPTGRACATGRCWPRAGAARGGPRGRRRRRPRGARGGTRVPSGPRGARPRAACPGSGPGEQAGGRGSSVSTSTRARLQAGATSAGSPRRATRATRPRRSCSGRARSACCSTPTGLPPRAGVLTPATAMGGVLVERLRARGRPSRCGPRPDPAGRRLPWWTACPHPPAPAA